MQSLIHKILITSYFLLIGIASTFAQRSTTFRGLLVDDKNEVLMGATVNWADTTINAVTDAEGWFEITRLDTTNAYMLDIHYVGYETSTVEILPDENHLRIVVKNNSTLQTVEVETSQKGTSTSTLHALNIENIKACELKRAACCSLAESFETNGTVNVSSTDAVTGTKDIEMLGLRGTYVQMQLENRPAMNRLDRAYGMEFLPGSWIEAIQISKGASTVRNGVQGITGQINIELLKPNRAPLFFINLYGSHIGRFELNANFNKKLNKRWSMGLLTHGNYFQNDIDHNGDAFLDVPRKKQVNVLNRWLYESKDWHIEFNAHGLMDKRLSGQTADSYHHTYGTHPRQVYSVTSDIQRLEGFGKVGYLGSKNPFESIALMYSGLVYNQTMTFGTRSYLANQRSIYINGIYQNVLFGQKEHGINVGAQFSYDHFDEQFSDLNLTRNEKLAGAYAEYDFTHATSTQRSFGIIVGGRFDAWILPTVTRYYASPRVNVKYNFSENTIVRLSGGRGVRMPNALMENLRYMPSAREFRINGTVLPETAWNYGVNMTHSFFIGNKEGSLNVDIYRTDFTNQLVSDVDNTNNQLIMYNLQGKSYANSFLITYSQDIAKGLNMRVAYKFNDVRSTYGDTLRLVPLTPQHRALWTVQYVTPKRDWQFDVTAQFVGKQRLPHENKPTTQEYVVLLAQVSKFFKNGLEIYVGGENLTNYRQSNPIIGYQNPFGTAFDASLVYAPIMGAMVYGGIRYTFDKNRGNDSKVPFKPVFGHDDHDGHDHEGEHAHIIEIKTSAQCGMCKTSIEDEIRKCEGVESVSLNLKTKIFTVEYMHGADVDAIRQKISKLGYDADDVKGDAAAYEQLPACCKKP